jgi:hypothetical protein
MSMSALFSCTNVIYTHDQVLDMYQTKAAVSKKLIFPDIRTWP